MPPKKQQLDQSAWQWAEIVEPDNIQWAHIEAAYRINLKPCKLGSCRRNCKGNPRCVNALGEGRWFTELKESDWHEVEDPENERRAENAFAGLKNLGATCYVNTFLQVWFHNKGIRNAVLGWSENLDTDTVVKLSQDITTLKQSVGIEELEKLLTPQSICGHLQQVFALLQFSKRRYIDPTPFINSLGLDAALQQDAQEFSKLFMSLLEDTLSQQQPGAHNFIEHQFKGLYEYVTRCSFCTSESRRPSDFYELDLNIKGHKNLNDCIEEFLKEEKLEGDNKYMCSGCSSKQNATRNIHLKSLPKVLNLQLLRFVFERQTGHKKKLNTYIEFPESLDMSVYMGRSGGEVVYELAAVLIHRGPSAYSGHYVAHIKDSTSETWYKFNDEEIEKMGGKNLQLGNEEELEAKGPKKPKTGRGFHASRNAYMLVYHRMANLALPTAKAETGEAQDTVMPDITIQKTDSLSNGTIPVPQSNDSAVQMLKENGLQSSLEPMDDHTCKSSESVENQASDQINATIDLPLRILRAIEIDNERFEDWVHDMKAMRQNNVDTAKARQNEVKEIISMLSWQNGEEFEWIKSDWLCKWASSDSSEKVPVIDNASLLCSHHKMDPIKVSTAKCISKKAAEVLYTKYGGSPRLGRDALCIECVKERCRIIRTKARMAEDNKAITTFNKQKDLQLSPSLCYWIGKLSLRSWKRLALEQVEESTSKNGYDEKEDIEGNRNEETLREDDKSIPTENQHSQSIDNNSLISTNKASQNSGNSIDQETQPVFSSTETLNSCREQNPTTSQQPPSITGSLPTQATSTEHSIRSSPLPDEELQFNEDILCADHDQLSIEESSRKLVTEDIWQRLKWYFPSAPEYKGDAEMCAKCKHAVEEESRLKALYKTLAAEQKASLNDLYTDKKRPAFDKSSIEVNVVSAEFVEMWRKFIRDPTRHPPLETVGNSSLLCPHGGFIYNPETIGIDESSQRLCLLYPDEWKILTQSVKSDIEISITRVKEDTGYVTYIVSPELCSECQNARLLEERKSKLHFKDETIYVRKLTSDKVSSAQQDDESGSSSKCSSPTKFRTASTGYNTYDINDSSDPDFIEDSKESHKRRKSMSDLEGIPADKAIKLDNVAAAAIGPIRRSTRHRKVRGEKELTVSSAHTLRDLKLQIMHLFSVAPFDQNLMVDDRLLKGDQNTLEDLGIYPGTTVYLKADEPVEDPIFLEDVSKASYPEEGFKGTGLLKR